MTSPETVQIDKEELRGEGTSNPDEESASAGAFGDWGCCLWGAPGLSA